MRMSNKPLDTVCSVCPYAVTHWGKLGWVITAGHVLVTLAVAVLCSINAYSIYAVRRDFNTDALVRSFSDIQVTLRELIEVMERDEDEVRGS